MGVLWEGVAWTGFGIGRCGVGIGCRVLGLGESLRLLVRGRVGGSWGKCLRLLELLLVRVGLSGDKGSRFGRPGVADITITFHSVHCISIAQTRTHPEAAGRRIKVPLGVLLSRGRRRVLRKPEIWGLVAGGRLGLRGSTGSGGRQWRFCGCKTLPWGCREGWWDEGGERGVGRGSRAERLKWGLIGDEMGGSAGRG